MNNRHRGLERMALTACLLLAAAAPAAAHGQPGQAAGFLSGVRHPISGIDHVLAMIAVGVWGAQLRSPAIWLLPVTFPLVMACGGFLALIGMPLPGTEIGIAFSALLLGLAIVAEARPPLAAAAVVVGAFALFHGHAHGTELSDGQSALTYSIGFVVATGCLHAVGIALGLVHRWPVGRTALRFAGAGIMAAGAAFCWNAL
jgi:urease accessory protein